MTSYRIQDADRNPAELLLEEHQWSCNWGGSGDPRRGVSVCDTEDDVIVYFQGHARNGIGYDADFLACMVMVAIDGEPSDDLDEDHAEGARLIIPTRIVSVAPLTAEQIAEILS